MGCGCGGGRRRNFARRAPVTPRSARRNRTAAEAQSLESLMSRKKSQASLIKNRRLIERKKRLAVARRILGN